MENVTDGHCTIDYDVSVVLPAGGCGERFGCHTPKQYSTLIDQPLIIHTITAFHRIPWIKKVLVVVNEQYVVFMQQLVLDHNLDRVVIVKGSSTRHRSIHAGVKTLAKEAGLFSVVIIHDAVRPFIDEDVVRKIASYAKTYGAAGVTRPLVSTVIAADEVGLLKESLDRNLYCASEMPQGFQLNVIKSAYEQATDEDFDFGTECLLLAMKYVGVRAKLFTGPDNLWKVTYRKDLYAAEAILKEKNIVVQVKFESGSENDVLKESIVSKCRNRNITLKEDKGSESHLINSYVFIYSDFSQPVISANTRCVHKQTDSCTGLSPLKPCVVHVCDGCSLPQDSTSRFMETIQTVASETPNDLVYGILNFNTCDYGRLSDMVTSLIWNPDPSLSGQTFFIHKPKDNT